MICNRSLYALGQTQQLPGAAPRSRDRRKSGNQFADPRAVDIGDFAQIEKYFLLPGGYQLAQGIAQRARSFAECNGRPDTSTTVSRHPLRGYSILRSLPLPPQHDLVNRGKRLKFKTAVKRSNRYEPQRIGQRSASPITPAAQAFTERHFRTGRRDAFLCTASRHP